MSLYIELTFSYVELTLKNHKLTLIGFVIAVGLWLAVFLTETDLFERLIEALKSADEFELDEFIVPLAVLGLFALADFLRSQRLERQEVEKVKIYKAMLASTHHILNNFLNQMQLFKMTAEETPGFPPEVLVLYDQIIRDAVVQIEALGSITAIDESTIFASVAPRPAPKPGDTSGGASGAERPRR